jgi:DtxR family Mn-dependent transcriptional regulator
MMKQLADRGLVDYRTRRGVLLTETGRAEALRVLRRHRLIELFLVEIMDMDWADVHDEAEALEHVVSDKLVARLDEMLGFPAHDPHGAPIPTAEGVMPRLKTVPLSECAPGSYRLIRVEEESGGFLSWLQQRGLLPGTRVAIEEVDRFAETLEIRRQDGRRTRIALHAAARLRVVPEGGKASGRGSGA